MISIRRQLTRELLAAFLVLLGGALAALYFAARDELIEQFDDALRTKAAAISSLIDVSDDKIAVDESDRLFRSFSEKDAVDFFEIWLVDGAVAARSDSLAGADLLPPGKRMVFPHARKIALPNGRSGRTVSMVFSITPEGGEHRADRAKEQLTLMVASDSEPLEEALTELLSIGAACGVIGLGATVWLVSRVTRRGLQPLARLGDQAAGINADSLTTRFPTGDLAAELQPIVSRLNELLARLEISFERERRFSADLAHELRTPLAELRSLAECALKWPDSRDRATDEEVLAAAMQMQTMVTSLLALSRAEQGQLVAGVVPVNLLELIQEAWHSYVAQAERRGLKVNLSIVPVSVMADPVLLRSVLGNLFENATDYTPVGGTIEIHLQAEEVLVRLRVANTVENFTASDLEKMFDRFWRKEEARSGGKHFGLGLSLARMFAEAMGWTLAAGLNASGQLEFTLVGPVKE